jgi:hypothetical protein
LTVPAISGSIIKGRNATLRIRVKGSAITIFESIDFESISRIIEQEQSMSAPSRRPEIRRRRTRKEKILKLRKSLAAASSETDRARFRAKLHRQGLVSPGTPLLKSE